MRSPVRPIPSPARLTERAQTYWALVDPPLPPIPRPASMAADTDYDPTRLLGLSEQTLGIDRRRARRAPPPSRAGAQAPAMARTGLLAAGHVRVDALVGLTTRHGGALLRTLSLAPTGLLAHVLDPTDPQLSAEERRRARAVFGRIGASLAPRGARSLLAAVGTCLLGARVVADLSTWVSRRAAGGPRTCTVAPADRVDVTVVVPTREPTPVEISGVVTALLDPDPGVLAIALSPSAHAGLAHALGLSNPGCGAKAPVLHPQAPTTPAADAGDLRATP